MDYPQGRFRVVVLDDGQDSALKKAIEDLQSTQYPHLYYHARIKTKPHHAKAGNLIGGTDYVTKLEGGAGEFIAALDADMIPEPDCERTRTHLVSKVVLTSNTRASFHHRTRSHRSKNGARLPTSIILQYTT